MTTVFWKIGSGLAVIATLWLAAGCGRNSVAGSVGGVEMSVEDAILTEFTWEGITYHAIIMTDVPDACNTFRADNLELGSTWAILQLWLTDLEPTDYPVYSEYHADSELSDGDPYALTWYMHVINDIAVVNTDGVAGVVQVSDFDYEKNVAQGSMDVIFSGNGNRLQGHFSAPFCEVEWETIVAQFLP